MKGLAVSLALCSFAFGQETQGGLTDKRIYELFTSGVQTGEILRIIATAPEIEFDLRPEATFALIRAGVPDAIIRAMAAREKGTALEAAAGLSEPPSRGASTSTIAAWPATREEGPSYQSNGQWVEMAPEIVHWKNGTDFRSYTTAGLPKGEITGELSSRSSRLRLTLPVQILVYCPEGAEITDYRFVRLRSRANSRQFLIRGRGRPYDPVDSILRDAFVHSRRIATCTWAIDIDVGPGEYGLLPPRALASSGAGGYAGKVYTFTVVE
jgi:hypothetical protein